MARKIIARLATVAFVALASIALHGVAIPASASTPSTDRPLVMLPAGVSCPAIMVYAIRGSGEKLSDDHGAGSQLWPVYQQLVKEYGARHVGLEANAYPAVPVTDPWVHLPDLWYLLHDYKPSVNRGVADAVADIKGYARKCHRGDHALVIAGYSQGADVARRALARINPTQTFSVGMRVSLSVLLFGDPNFNPAERDLPPYDGTADEQGSFQSREGVGRWADRQLHAMPVAPRLSFWYNLRSWCYHGDPVCQVGGLHFEVHSRYAARYAYAATTFVSAAVPQEVATPDCIFLRNSPSSRRIEVSPEYFPAPSNPGGTTVLTTYIDGRLVDSRTIRFVSNLREPGLQYLAAQ